MSCLVEKFSYYLKLTQSEKDTLLKLEKDSRDYAKNKIIYQQNKELNEIMVVREGWLMSFAYMQDGGRLVLHIYHPGDVIGTMSIPFVESPYGLMSLTPCTLCPFPKSGMKELLKGAPRLTALLFSMGMQDNVVLLDRLKAVGRMSGENRVAMLLLQVWTRLNITCKNISNTFDFPISQEIIADALGITPVYVNRMLKRLQKDGWIDYERKAITLHDPEELGKRCDFIDRYYALDTSWYPDA